MQQEEAALVVLADRLELPRYDQEDLLRSVLGEVFRQRREASKVPLVTKSSP